MLLTLSSGVKGLTTIHAGSARQALTRLRFICQLADTSSELPMSALNSLVSEAIDIVVHCTRMGDEVRVAEVVAVEDLQTARDATAFTVTELFRRERPGAPLTWTGNLPVRAARPLEMAGYDVRQLLDTTRPYPVAQPDGASGGDPASRPRPRARARTAPANGGTEGEGVNGLVQVARGLRIGRDARR